MIIGVQENLFVVLCDFIYVYYEIYNNLKFDFVILEGISNVVFYILCNVGVVKLVSKFNLVVCWGGYLILQEEYDYMKVVGYQFGLCDFDICIGCGFGVMKGLMKGVIIVYVKQCILYGCYLGFIELGIVVVEVFNLIVNYLVIFFDVEKCLEVFVCIGYGFVVFFGGVGMIEEILYIFGIFFYFDNFDIFFLFVFMGLKSIEGYFEELDCFIGDILGIEVQQCYKVIIDNLVLVVCEVQVGIEQVYVFCKEKYDVFYFNW